MSRVKVMFLLIVATMSPISLYAEEVGEWSGGFGITVGKEQALFGMESNIFLPTSSQFFRHGPNLNVSLLVHGFSIGYNADLILHPFFLRKKSNFGQRNINSQIGIGTQFWNFSADMFLTLRVQYEIEWYRHEFGDNYGILDRGQEMFKGFSVNIGVISLPSQFR